MFGIETEVKERRVFAEAYVFLTAGLCQSFPIASSDNKDECNRKFIWEEGDTTGNIWSTIIIVRVAYRKL